MPYPGLTFAIMVGVALGTAIYYYFNQENANQQRHNSYEYDGRNCDGFSSNNSWSDSSELQSSRRRRRNSMSKCSICLDDINKDKIKTISECGHEFHEYCIVLWLKQNKNCPNCRQPVYT